MKERMTKYMCISSGACILLCAGMSLLAVRGYAGGTEAYIRFLVIMIAAVIVMLVIAVLAAHLLSSKMTEDIQHGGAGYSEIKPLVKRIEKQKSQIKSSEGELAEKEKNLDTIMEHMTEGLVLLDHQGLIMSMNKAASDMLGIPAQGNTGKHLFAFNQHPTLQSAVHDALGGISASELMDTPSGMAVQILANPVMVDGVIRGAVLLSFDVTEKAAAEQMRREFSANVSHELKTPLTSISGYAEIMKDGMVKPQDMERFAGNIYNEAQRLITLIDDIIKLSRLDEQSQSEITKAEVELLPLTFRVADRLKERAESGGVELMVSGSEEWVYGNAQLLEEMIYNLCDNSIKYNHAGGWAHILVGRLEGAAAVTVSDNGIGIPKEHQERIFERFYRVDKSHSRETGGTGLGLSIVKHGARFHGAEVRVTSEPGKGTEITLIFKGDENR